MRTIPAAMTPEMAEIYSRSTWLIRLITVGDTPQTITMSTREQVTWDTLTWTRQGAMVAGAVSQDSFAFSMPNETGQILTLASGGELKRAAVDIFVMYPDASDAVQFMQGVVSGVSGLMNDRAVLRVERYKDENSIVPTVLIASPGWTTLPPSNLSIEWDGNIIEVRRGR